jgi:hypothetical protein
VSPPCKSSWFLIFGCIIKYGFSKKWFWLPSPIHLTPWTKFRLFLPLELFHLV